MDAKVVPLMSPNIPLPSGADVINKLPNEVLLMIFGHLDSKFIVQNISKVSQRFETLSKDSTLIRKMEFRLTDRSDKSMVDTLKRSKNLIELTFVLCDEPYVTHLLNMAMKNCPKLITINIRECIIYDIALLCIINENRIESLTFIDCEIKVTPINLMNIYPIKFRRLKNLCHLCFIPEKMNLVNHKILETLANTYGNLEDLTLGAFSEPENIQQEYLYKFLANSKYLTRLVVNDGLGNNMFPHQIFALFKRGHLKNLKELVFTLEDEFFDEYEDTEIIEAIDKGCPNLEVLWLCHFDKSEFDNGRIVYCKTCDVYHLKKQRSLKPGKCPFENIFTPED